MPDREKVISEFSECVQRGGWIHCGNCEYKNANVLLTCEPLAKEILALLKEQEDKIRQLRLALQILNGNGIKVDTESR